MNIALALILVIAFSMKSVALAATTQPSDDYHLVWSDEFNHDGPLNSDDWKFETGFARNRELQWYQAGNAVCKDGCLVIEARKENRPNPNFDAHSPLPATNPTDLANPFFGDRFWRNRKTIEYTSASVNTSGIHSWLYGRFEIRAKIDVRAGSWPAFWLLGMAGDWPANGEVDVMEYYDSVVLANIAWAGKAGSNESSAMWNAKRIPLSSFARDFADQFHTWRMDWDADSIKLYLDDALLNSQDLSDTINRPPLRRGAVENPFHTPMYILLNQAIGGTRGGDPSATEFPMRYLVDYVRVYQNDSQRKAATTKPSRD